MMSNHFFLYLCHHQIKRITITLFIMKRSFPIMLAICYAICLLPASGKKKAPATAQVQSVSLTGYIGQRIDDCIKYRVKTQNVNEIVSPFLKQDEVREMWGSEFWGKWVQGAMSSYRYNHDAQLFDMIKTSAEGMKVAQLSNGYIGNYDEQHQLKGWDVWGRKYTTLGLLKWYQLSGDKSSLDAAKKLIDYTMSQVGPGKHHIYECGYYKGMPPASILEPVMLLYKATLEPRYLEFAQFIVSDCEQEGGPQLLAKADVPVWNRFPIQNEKEWWSAKNGQKAYEMMSCYVGLLELYKVVKDERYLEIVKTVTRHIMDEEINICGSGAANECWYGGKERQTRPAYHSMETCVTFTWMQLNERLLQITNDPIYADNIETTIYNALMASMKADGSQIAKYTPLEGFRVEGERQCGLNINCCNANGPRAFAMIPRFAYMTRGVDSIDVNFYAPSEAQIQLDKQTVHLQMVTDYPVSDRIEITVNTEKEATFMLSLRIPAWSEANEVAVNGEKISGVHSGSYCRLNRTWKNGDKVTLKLDLRTRIHHLNHMQALTRGPITLARDTRFKDGWIDECCVIPQKDGYVELTPITAPTGMWMAFKITAMAGTDTEIYKPIDIHFCDFASAGNQWTRKESYKVWLNPTLNVQLEPKP